MRVTPAAVVLLAALPAVSVAQPTDDLSTELWLDYDPSWSIAPNTEFYGDIGARSDLKVSGSFRIVVRPSIRFRPNSTVRIAGGLGSFYTSNDVIANRWEIHPWQGVTVTWPRPFAGGIDSARFSISSGASRGCTGDRWGVSKDLLRFWAPRAIPRTVPDDHRPRAELPIRATDAIRRNLAKGRTFVGRRVDGRSLPAREDLYEVGRLNRREGPASIAGWTPVPFLLPPSHLLETQPDHPVFVVCIGQGGPCSEHAFTSWFCVRRCSPMLELRNSHSSPTRSTSTALPPARAPISSRISHTAATRISDLSTSS